MIFIQLQLLPFLQVLPHLCKRFLLSASDFWPFIHTSPIFHMSTGNQFLLKLAISQILHSGFGCTKLCLISKVCCVPKFLVETSWLYFQQVLSSQKIWTASFDTNTKIARYWSYIGTFLIKSSSKTGLASPMADINLLYIQKTFFRNFLKTSSHPPTAQRLVFLIQLTVENPFL